VSAAVAVAQPVSPPGELTPHERQKLLKRAEELNVRVMQLFPQGRAAEALPLAEEAVQIDRRLYPAGHANLASSLNNLGVLRQAAGDLAGAEKVHREALAMRRRLFPPERFAQGHPELAISLHNVGDLLRVRGDLAGAEALLREALAMRRRLFPPERFPDGHPKVALSLNTLGLVCKERGAFDQAGPLLREALAMRQTLYPRERYPQGHPELATSLSSLGSLLVVRQDFVAAEPYLRQALAMLRQLYPAERFPAGHSELAFTLSQLATARGQREDFAEAEALVREALAMCRKLYPPVRYPAGHPELARSLRNLADLCKVRGALADAERLYHDALAAYRKLYPAGHAELARCLRGLGELFLIRGDLPRAERYHRDSLALYQKLYPRERFPDGHADLALALSDLGYLLGEHGELARAESYYREALAMRQRLYPKARYPVGHPDLAISLNNLGTALAARGEWAAAEPYYRDALVMRQRLYPKERYPDGHPDLALSFNNLGGVLRDQGDLAGAEPLFRAALAMQQRLYPAERYPDGHERIALALHNLGGLLAARGAPAQGEALLRQSLAMHKKLYPPTRYPAGHPDLANSLDELSSLLRGRGKLAESADLSRAALLMRQRLLEAFLAGAAEAEALNHLAHVPLTRDGYLSTTRDLAGSAAAAYTAVWTTRGLLARWLSQRRLAARAATDPATDDLARRLAAKRRALAALLLTPSAAGRGQEMRIQALSEEKEELEKQLARALPAFDHQLRAARHSPEDLRQRLPAGAVFVDVLRYVHFAEKPGQPFARRTPSYVAFVLGRDQAVRRVELGPAAPIDAAVAAWHAALSADRDERPAAQQIARLVWAPVREHLPAGTATVYLVPDGRLTQLPWAALAGSKPGTVLLEEYALAVEPHGHFLLEQLAEVPPAPRAGRALLVVGGVAYDKRPAAPVVLGAGRGREARPEAAKGAWPALPGTERELERVLSLAGKRPVIVRRGDAASTAQLLVDLPQAHWAHLATHGFFADARFRSAFQLSEKAYQRGVVGERIGVGARSPLALSGLVLAGANVPVKDLDKEDSGVLTAEAIAGLDLDGLELAVLSACETGLGEVAGGEGVFGLQRAFHIAGARNVIASLWQVDDEATAALMGLFYNHLWVEKMAPLEALRQAQLGLYQHPERIAVLARERGPDFEKAARLPATPQAAGRAPPRLWAGFVLSGAGR
jgi:CHAT domain-containing protein